MMTARFSQARNAAIRKTPITEMALQNQNTAKVYHTLHLLQAEIWQVGSRYKWSAGRRQSAMRSGGGVAFFLRVHFANAKTPRFYENLRKCSDILPTARAWRTYCAKCAGRYLSGKMFYAIAPPKTHARLAHSGKLCYILPKYRRCKGGSPAMLLAKNIAPRVLLGVALVVLLAGCAPERLAGTVFDQRPTRYGTSADVAASGPFALRTTPDFDDAPGGYAENWPSRPVTLVVSFLPGGNTDIYARVFVPFLEDALGQHINVVNIDGGAGTLGATLVSEAPSNGYTMLFYHTGNMFSNIIHAGTEINYDDFLISCVAVRCTTNVMLINADFGISTAQEFLAYARANPDVLRAATTGSGFSYTLTRMAEAIGDFRTTSINVGAMALMMDAVRGGDADIATVILAVAEPFIESGEMIPLWIAAGERHPSLPHVPTLAEIGIENGYIGNSYFFAFPPGTNPNIARRLSDALEEIVASPEFAQQMFDVARTPAYFVPFDYARDHLHNLWNELSAFEEYEE